MHHRTLEFLFDRGLRPSQSHTQRVDQLRIYAAEGHQLRSALDDWKVTASLWQLLETRAGCQSMHEDRDTIGNVFYAAISIYLSGIFDYYRQFWDDNKIEIPALPLCEIKRHTTNIVSLTSNALEHSTLSGVLFFFPLRVAGARSHCGQQRRAIRDMLVKISSEYVVATSFLDDLDQHWNKVSG